MNNRHIYSKDPATRKLVNEGVASVNDDLTEEALAVLRYELETFVCDGQYEKGLEHILATYLANIDQAQQPAAWVSGFFGSGKSHLVKMLRALWINTEFPDGAAARGIKTLPQGVQDHLRELTTQGKRHGGLHAASGTLGASASGSVRLALLRIVFKSAGLPEQYPVARFVMWLRSEGIYDDVRTAVESAGHDWHEELDNFYVAEGLHAALIKSKPNLFSSTATCVETLNNLYPFVQDISSDDMLKALRQALASDGKFPLTLIVLDEIQQYIGEDRARTNAVQEAVEACCKNIGGKLLFIGTGQTAVTGTPNLKQLEGRFTVRVELSDADVDAVIRQVILAKKPEAIDGLKAVMDTNLGEISRHLSGTTIGHRQKDIPFFAQDYPILPVRRRFWEHTLRVLDPTGTDSQLRNQLTLVHKVIQTNLDSPIGHVISADYLYFDTADRLLQARLLPRKIHEQTMSWASGNDDEALMARACGLVFLINKLAGSNNEIGICATVDTIADLMITDLSGGSSALRTKLPALLAKCPLLITVGDEYRIQTEESAAWNDEFLSQRNQLANEAHRVEAERDDRIRKRFGELTKKLSLPHGHAKVSRDMHIVFGAQLPADANTKICVWVRDEWSIDENSVRVDARQAGNQSPCIFVFVPKRSPDDLRHQLIDFKASSATLEKRGVPTGPEGLEARAAMETAKQTAEGKINELLDESFSGARVFQAGGAEIVGNDLRGMIIEGGENALQRLYPHFPAADHAGWDKVYAKAKQGAPDALKCVGDDGEPAKNPVCKTILGHIAAGKKGSDIRAHFEAPLFGWSRDAVDGGLLVLLVAGLVRAQDDRGQNADPKDLERKAIGKTTFKVESTTITTAQRIQIRKLLQRLGIQAKQGEETSSVPEFLQQLLDLANRAGGGAPRPERPTTTTIDEIRLAGRNEQLLAVYNQRDELKRSIEEWDDQAQRIESRWPSWQQLQELLGHAGELKAVQEAKQQAEALTNQRLLLSDPDPIQPLLSSVADAVRNELMGQRTCYADRLSERTKELEADSSWQQLPEDERADIRAKCDIAEPPTLSVGTHADLVATLEHHPIVVWHDRIDALPGRFDRARELAAKAIEPEAQTVEIPRRTLKTDAEIEAWLEEVGKQLKTALSKGPIVIR